MLGFVFVLGACVLWAIDSLIRYPLINGGVSAFSIVFYEHVLLVVIFFIVFYKSLPKFWKINPKHILYFFVIGGVGSALATLSFTKAFSLLNPSLVIILQKLQPIVAISLARVVLKERFGRHFIFWASICLVGGVLVSYEDILHLTNSKQNLSEILFHPGAGLGYILVLFSVLGWGSATVFGKKLSLLGYKDEQIMGGRFILGLLALLPFLPFSSQILSHGIEVYSKVSLMVLLSGLLAMYLYYHGLRKISARACSLTEMFFPFMAVIVNWLVLGAQLTPLQILGGGLLLIGSVTIQLKQY